MLAFTYPAVPIAIFLAVMVIGSGAYKSVVYDFIEPPPRKNISCFECNNYSFNTTGDRRKYAVLNKYCETEPERVRHFKKRCSSSKAIGCGVIRTRYTQYAHNPLDRVTYHVNRFCVDRLLTRCDVSESSRGTITLCTCSGSFCNSAEAVRHVNLGLLIIAAAAASIQWRT